MSLPCFPSPSPSSPTPTTWHYITQMSKPGTYNSCRHWCLDYNIFEARTYSSFLIGRYCEHQWHQRNTGEVQLLNSTASPFPRHKGQEKNSEEIRNITSVERLKTKLFYMVNTTMILACYCPFKPPTCFILPEIRKYCLLFVPQTSWLQEDEKKQHPNLKTGVIFLHHPWWRDYNNIIWIIRVSLIYRWRDGGLQLLLRGRN